jgi:hypothetical protein
MPIPPARRGPARRGDARPSSAGGGKSIPSPTGRPLVPVGFRSWTRTGDAIDLCRAQMRISRSFVAHSLAIPIAVSMAIALREDLIGLERAVMLAICG